MAMRDVMAKYLTASTLPGVLHALLDLIVRPGRGIDYDDTSVCSRLLQQYHGDASQSRPSRGKEQQATQR